MADHTQHSIGKADRTSLSQLLAINVKVERIWEAAELQAILEHQMASPVQFELGPFPPALAERFRELAAARKPLLRSFSDLLNDPNPPVELLEMTKEYGKASRNHPDGPLPPEIGLVLYYGAIVAALLTRKTKITELDDAALAMGLRTSLAKPWLDDQTRKLFNRGLGALDATAGDIKGDEEP